jgi:hypothetical protein
MIVQHPDDPNTVIQVSTESLPVRPTKPEPFTEAEREQTRRANRIRHREILKMFNWSASDYEAAVKFGFARAEGPDHADRRVFLAENEHCRMEGWIARRRAYAQVTIRARS